MLARLPSSAAGSIRVSASPACPCGCRWDPPAPKPHATPCAWSPFQPQTHGCMPAQRHRLPTQPPCLRAWQPAWQPLRLPGARQAHSLLPPGRWGCHHRDAASLRCQGARRPLGGGRGHMQLASAATGAVLLSGTPAEKAAALGRGRTPGGCLKMTPSLPRSPLGAGLQWIAHRTAVAHQPLHQTIRLPLPRHVPFFPGRFRMSTSSPRCRQAPSASGLTLAPLATDRRRSQGTCRPPRADSAAC